VCTAYTFLLLWKARCATCHVAAKPYDSRAIFFSLALSFVASRAKPLKCTVRSPRAEAPLPL